MMRNTIFILLLFAVFSSGLYSQVDENEKETSHKFILGAGFTYANNPRLFGGHFEFGINIYKRIFYIQNNVILRAGGLSIDSTDYSIFTLSEKIIFGRNSDSPLSIYTYLEAGMGIYGNDKKNFFADPIAYTIGFGGGGELGSDDFGGFYIEIGYLGQRITINYPVSGIVVQTGWRIFF